MPLGRIAIFALALASAALTGCDAYPPADEVAACAANRLRAENGVFSVTKRSGSMLSTTEYAIVYQRDGSPDRAVVVYSRRNGPVSTQQEISFGNRTEITDAVDAIRLCAQPR